MSFNSNPVNAPCLFSIHRFNVAMNSLDNKAEPAPAAPPRSKWPWIMLTLWAAWLAILIIMSWAEWGRERQSHDEPVPAKKIDKL